ncbi:MAG: T9SS type A sorting domain-containing protein [Bacteroidota bacterium]
MKKNIYFLVFIAFGLTIKAQSPRMMLYEEFTGETCPPCASTNPGLNTLLLSATNATRVVAIKWQVPIPSAPSNTWSLYQTDKTEIDWRWKSGTANYNYVPAVTYAPLGKIDGQSQAVFGATGGSPDHPANLTNAIITTACSYTSAFNVTMSRSAITSTSTSADVFVTIQATGPYTTGSNLVFRNVLVERLINFSVQPGTNGEKDFNDAARKSYPTLQNGTALPTTWTVGQVMTFSMSCVFPPYIMSNAQIEFVGFIQNDGTQKVEQTTRTDIQHLGFDASAVSPYVGFICNSSNTLAPNVAVRNDGLGTITAMTITPYVDGLAKNVTTWTGSLTTGLSTFIALNAFNSSTISGQHTFSYNISALNSADNNLSNNGAKANYYSVYNYQSNPIVEGFSASAWPYSGWTVNNTNAGSATWSFQNGVEAYNMGIGNCMKYAFFKNTVLGDKDELMLPPVNLSGIGTPTMSFDLAYVLRTATSNDKLEVMASKDCGATWTSIWNASGSNLATSQSPNANEYVSPAIEDWSNIITNLPGFNNTSVLVKFVTTNNNGNNLYIDNINLSSSSIPDGIAKNNQNALGVNVYPNPNSGIANVQITSRLNQVAKLRVMNALGQVVFEKQLNLTLGTNNSMLDLGGISEGIYTISIEGNQFRSTNKLVITK